MISKIIEGCAQNRFFVLFFVAFLVAAGWWSLRNVPLDAIPDLSDVQVIVWTEWPGRSPDLIEDQVTYPIVTAFISAPRVKTVRGFTDFGVSYVYVIFQDGTDLYWARSRVLEYLQGIRGRLPEGVNPVLGPDATGVGWVFEYALVDETGEHNLAQLRSLQDWYLRYWLAAVPGVAEVAAIGGFVKQYQVQVDPNKLAAYRIPLKTVVENIQRSNNDVEGRLLEFSGREYMVRGRGYIRNISDIEEVAVAANAMGTPIRVKDVARVTLGPDLRRGIAEMDGKGEVVGGIVIVRFGENALNVIDGVKAKLREVESSLPKGVRIVPTYDRSDLIRRSIHTLEITLLEELLIVSGIILLFLWHLPSALIPILTIPTAVMISFIPMRFSGVTSNIMSLGGIAIAIGAMVDAAIIVVEQVHKKLERWDAEGKPRPYREVIIEAVQEVGGPSFFSLLVIAVSFIPIFTLEAQEGRLFRPLAFTKNFSMAIAAVLAITLVPALSLLFIRAERFRFRPRWLSAVVSSVAVGTIHHETKHPISRILIAAYQPVAEMALRFRWLVILAAIAVVASTVPVFLRLGSEFMPPLNEGTILYMPTALPGLSITEAGRLVQIQDRILRQFPEVESVFGTAGRANTATDNTPMGMVNTTVALKPQEQWRHVPVERWYSHWAPEFLRGFLRQVWPETRPISMEELVAEMDQKLQFPGFPNVWTMPIRNRIDMLTTGIKTAVGIKIAGPDLEVIQRLGKQIEPIVSAVPGTRSVYAERVAQGYFTDIRVDRVAAARYGLTVGDVEDVIQSAIGGENVTQTIEGRERYPVNVRYERGLRDDLEQLRRVLVPTPRGAQIPLGQLADIRLTLGPSMIRDEGGLLAGYVYIDMGGRDLGGYVQELQRTVAARLALPPGYTLTWTGQYEYKQRAEERLRVVVPLTLFVVFLLLYLNTRSTAKTLIVLLAVPFSAVGAIWLLYYLGYNMSIGVWVGLIALMGVDAETGVFMLLYLDLAYEEMRQQGRMKSWADLREAVLHGAVQRVRPKVMTVAVMLMGLLPIMWSAGTGADVMKRIAAPMIGGILTSFIMELIVYPPVYTIWKWHGEVKHELGRAKGLPTAE
ncbi:MAG: cation transporter [Acidobacteria bacterium RIFCSPLOWO2_02_FULL_61_28]|nr:MAG: cation transporter [Acidobacteria bacterium RIFCSPLOWO2_02_FULL_61_28]